MLVLYPRPIRSRGRLQRRYSTQRKTSQNLPLRQHFIRELLRRCVPQRYPTRQS